MGFPTEGFQPLDKTVQALPPNPQDGLLMDFLIKFQEFGDVQNHLRVQHTRDPNFHGIYLGGEHVNKGSTAFWGFTSTLATAILSYAGSHILPPEVPLQEITSTVITVVPPLIVGFIGARNFFKPQYPGEMVGIINEGRTYLYAPASQDIAY